MSDAFSRYVDRAHEGRPGIWRLLAGVVVILIVWAVATMVILTVGAFLSPEAAADDPLVGFDRFLASPFGAAAALATFAGMTAGVALALKLVDRRSFGTVLGASGRFAWGDFARGFAASLIATGIAEAGTFFVDTSLERNDIALSAWLLWLGPLLLLLFVQVSAEELAFRGYLMQSLAARFRSPFIWAGIPIVLFTLLHWQGSAGALMMTAMLLSIGAFAILATLLVMRTGNLGAATGAHLGLNVFGILFVSHMSWLQGGALFRGEPLDSGTWSMLDAVLVAVVSIGSFALMWLFLFHPRSPLTLRRA